MMKRLLLILLAALAFAAVPARAYEKEYIVLSGGPSLMEWEKYKAVPHDHYWGNFIRSARIRIEEMRNQYGPAAHITWLTYAEGYRRRSKQDQQDLIANIYSVRDKYGIKLVLFDNKQEVIDYLNNGEPRDQVKIADLEYFGHSNRACFMFDYSNEIDSASKCWLHENDFVQLKRGIFARDAFVKSWGCHTGEEMSQRFRDATGVRMYGAVGRTDYSNGLVPVLATAEDHWAY